MDILKIDQLLNQGDATAKPSVGLRKGIRSGPTAETSHFKNPPLHQIDYLNSALLACAVVTHNSDLEAALNGAAASADEPLTLKGDDGKAPTLKYCYKSGGNEVQVDIGHVFPALKPRLSHEHALQFAPSSRVEEGNHGLKSPILDQDTIRGRVSQINSAMNGIKIVCETRYKNRILQNLVNPADSSAAREHKRRQVKILRYFTAGATPPRVVTESGHGVFADAYAKHLPDIVKKAADALGAEGSGFDDMCAVIARENDLDACEHTSPAEILCHAMPYSAVAVLREKNLAGPMPFQASANVVVVCPSRSCLVLQRKGSVAHPGHPHTGLLHTFGGGYLAERNLAVNDHGSLVRTARREIFEESNFALAHDLISAPPPAIILKQEFLSFFQYAFLGWPVSGAELDSRNTHNPEGGVACLDFADLPELLGWPDGWASAGAMAVLMWLSLGAPGAYATATFGKAGCSAEDACDKVLAAWRQYR